MNDRTLIKVSAGDYCIGFKTVSWRRKSPRTFLVPRSALARLEQRPEVITQDIHSFASLRLDAAAGTLTIDFSWLQQHGDNGLTGWEETGVLIVFVDKEGLRKCLENRTVRGKLARALRDNFRGADRVEFYHDFEAYSFMFESYRAGRSSIVGGLILHDQGNLKKAHYSVHT